MQVSHSSLKRAKSKIQVTSVSQISVSGKVIEWMLFKAISTHIKDKKILRNSPQFDKELIQSRTSQEQLLADPLNFLKDGCSEIKIKAITPILAFEYENDAIGTMDMDK